MRLANRASERIGAARGGGTAAGDHVVREIELSSSLRDRRAEQERNQQGSHGYGNGIAAGLLRLRDIDAGMPAAVG
jgi:hypothetical protein